jgi:adenine-specific DNA methylase
MALSSNECKTPQPYPKRLIEVDLPIKRISAHARREKSIRHGHISTLHIWWARRPLAACRAVICAALWPDPGDPLCPEAFRAEARRLMGDWAAYQRRWMGEESRVRFVRLSKEPGLLQDGVELRRALLDFIADFANWDNSTVKEYLETSRALTQAAHEALGGAPGTRPLVVDPFAGGGSIPLEALRVGADAFASDLNPVAVLLNKVVLEYIPKYGQRLADEVRKWGAWIKEEAEKELAEFYPRDPDGATPIAYLWARTIRCEGPGCGAEVPLIRSLWLAKKANRSVALQIVPLPNERRVDFRIIVKQTGGWSDQADPLSKIANPKFDGTVKRGSGTCPCCAYTTPVTRVSEQLNKRRGGANDARLLCIVRTKDSEQGRIYRLPVEGDFKAVRKAKRELNRRIESHQGALCLIPDEPLPPQGTLGFRVQRYGIEKWGDFFTARQQLTLVSLVGLVEKAAGRVAAESEQDLAEPVQIVLGLAVSRLTDIFNSLCMWETSKTQVRHLFTRQAVPMLWDFAETSAQADAAGNYDVTLGTMVRVLESAAFKSAPGHVERCNATKHPLPNDSASAFVTDPPYYDAVPYADLSDFFYVWLKRSLPTSLRSNFAEALSPKADECIVDEIKGKDRVYFEDAMKRAMMEGRRVLSPDGVGIVVFAHKSTAGWEAQLQAMIDAGWIMTGSWPIDTELGNRLRAQGSAALASSVHLVCRPRENPDGSIRADEVGDWRDVLAELPKRIHDWMPRLAEEGVVGADAIFACLGPALEIFSRYSRVEKASGEVVPLKEYLEQVWAAVAREALGLVFAGADTSEFEPDARLTAMWLWTLRTGDGAESASPDDDESDDDADAPAERGATGMYVLEYDAARKIAQGLGAHLEKMGDLVEVKGDRARLLSAGERAPRLFGKADAAVKRPAKARKAQMGLFDSPVDLEEATHTGVGGVDGAHPGVTVLDRVHQGMILFAAGRGEALKRFLLDDGAGQDARFWRLAQALSALYPAGSEEKRWVDGVLARKKALGL